jgi:hypothetical protein
MEYPSRWKYKIRKIRVERRDFSERIQGREMRDNSGIAEEKRTRNQNRILGK